MEETPRRKWPFVLGIVIALLALGFWLTRGTTSTRSLDELSGKRPLLVEAESESVPTVSLSKPIGWKAGEAPTPAKGLEVARFADGLNHPRTMLTLPNADVLVALTNAPEGSGSGFFFWLFKTFVGAGDPSPNEIVLLRDADGDGKAEGRFSFRKDGLDSPSGMALVGNKLYIANHDAVLAFDYTPGDTELKGAPRKVMDLPPAGDHWMRNLLASKDGKALYIAVGSATNIADDGVVAEEGRAAIWELNLETLRQRQYAVGLRNPNGMAWNPSTGELWTVVNERDMLGPDLVPDYLTNVPVGAQYGWPWLYWKDQMDWRVKYPIPDYLNEYTRKPEYSMGPHVAPLGLEFVTGGQRMGADFANGAFVARHGSWNRKPPAGYDVAFVSFDANGNPLDLPKPVLTGFLTGEGDARGRPTWLAWDKGGALLVSDDTGGVIWRVIAPGAAPAAAVKPVVVARMPARRQIDAPSAASFGKEEEVKVRE